MRRQQAVLIAFLAIEFLDELVFGIREASWPLIRDDLGLTYSDIGVLLAVPAVVSSVIEPGLGLLSDVWRRRLLIAGGGVLFAAALLLSAASHSLGLLLISFSLFYPASGAFVSLSQASLMDLMPSRHEQNMARWTLAGSLGVLAGSLAVRAAYSLDLTWRGLFVGCAVIGAALAGLAWRLPIADSAVHHTRLAAHLAEGFRQALAALRRGSVVRWLVLLRFSDLMLDVLLGFLALYFTDVVGIDPRQAGLAVAVWTGAGLIGDLLLIPLLERIHGLTYLRVSAALELALYAALLLVPALWLKLVLLGLLGLFNAGWYAIPKAQLFSAMPGQSGASQAVNNVVDLLGPLVPLGIGLLAQQIGLGLAMWVLLLGPIAFLLGIPRRVQP